MKNNPYFDRQYVYDEAQFTHYDYMHIRMKQQSTKYMRASPTSNSQPKYVIVTINRENILNVYDITTKAQNPG